MDDKIDYYLKRLRSGDHDAAFRALIHSNSDEVSHLIEAYQKEENTELRTMLVEIIWQNRYPETVSFLGEVLQEDSSEIWKMALDGLVTFGSREALAILKGEEQRLLNADEPSRLEWVQEAISQIE